MRTLEALPVAPGDHRPLQECLISDCGELPAGANLAEISTWVPEARAQQGALPCVT